MKICVDSSTLGTQNSLVIGLDGSCQWQDSPEECDIYLKCEKGLTVESLAVIQGLSTESLSLADSSQIRAFSSLGVSSQKIPWVMALGDQKFISHLKQIIKSIQDVTRDTELVRYVETYRRGNKILEALQRPRIDIDRMRHHRSSDNTGTSPLVALESFSPDKSGLAPPIEYDRISTSTGRLKVSRGPSVLTIQKEYRDIIKSRSGGSIYEVDFVSLEPRVALNIMGCPPPRDIYEGIRERLHMTNASRSSIKQAVISSLYGSSSSSLSESLGGRLQALELIKEVKKYFQVPEMVSMIRSSMARSAGRLHNYYGRPLVHAKDSESDAKLISHYLQSTAVDVALLGFSDLCDRLKSHNSHPIYVIHDALLVDVPRSSETNFLEQCNLGIDLEVGHFELGVNKIS